ncbi:MAG: MBL fold metallo-hydrolase [Oscillospiraceae bacterium]|nr:MBL fold metallo-hydrolase [Oscillospiraceae bacterium]
MKISVLVENTTTDGALKPKHGLSLYIETSRHKVLFDLGPDDTYLENARKLGIDLAEVDTVVLSHGHKDHGGALAGFLQMNSQAKIYLHKQAFEPYFIRVLFAKVPIGLDEGLRGNGRFVLTDGVTQIDDELFLFSDVKGNFVTKSNRVLLKKTARGYAQDDFAHEQNLIVTAEGKTALFSGCSHRGIANILCRAEAHKPGIEAVFGGFHLYNPATKAVEPPEVVAGLIDELSAYDAVFYTGHCTGDKAFAHMRDRMGERVQALSTGTVIAL